MTSGAVFPAFLQLRHDPNGQAKASFLAEINSITDSGEKRFRQFSAQAQRMLDSAMTTRRNNTGSLDLGVPELQRQATALQHQAIAARELAMATDLAAKEAGDYSQAARLQVAAMQAAAIEAEQAAASARDYALAQEQVQTVLNRNASAVTAVIAASGRHQVANDNATASTKASSFAMQQLSFQLNDVSTQFAMGTPPMQIFAQQAGHFVQVFGLMAQSSAKGGEAASQSGADIEGMGETVSGVAEKATEMGGKLGGVATFLAGPWGAAIIAATAVLVPFISKMFESEEAMDEVEFASSRLGNAQSILGQVMDTTTGKITTQSEALLGLARAQALAGQISARQQIATARGELADEAAIRPHVTAGFGGGLNVTRGRDATGDIASAVLDNSLNTSEAVAGLESLRRTGYATEQQFLETARAVTDLGVAAEDLKAFQALERMLTGVGTAADRALLLDPAKVSRAHADALSDEQKALKQATEESARYIASLEEEIAKIGLGPAELRQLEIVRARDAAGTDVQRRRIEELNAAREEALSTLQRQEAAERAARAAADFQAQALAPLEQELALLGLVGPAREMAALALEEEAFKADLTAKGVEDVNAAWERYLDLRTQIIEGDSALERDRQEAELLAQELERLVGAVSNLGGAGSVLGGLLGFASGNLSAIGGSAGTLLNTVVGTQTDAEGKVVARRLGDELREVFGKSGIFGETLTDVLSGASTGLIAGNAIFGQQDSIDQLGAGIGGAFGQVGGEAIGKALGSSLGALGSAAGPIGSIVGSIAGSLLASQLSATPRGSATIGGSGGMLGISGTAGNSAARIAASSKSASAIIEGLDRLASELGATIDASLGRVSIGVRDGNYRVDTSGRGITKTKKGAIDFGEDAEAAAYAAMMDLIQDGVLVGLRAGTERLLKNAKDLEKGISDALAFEGVFARIKAMKDPIGAELDGLDAEFERYTDMFQRASATSQEWIDLEQLYWDERDELLKDAMDRELGTLRDFLSDLSIGNDALSLRDRKASALAAYTPLAERVSAGDAAAYDDFAAAARALLDIERQLSGSQDAYFDLLNQVTGLTRTAAGSTTGPDFTGRDSPFGARGPASDNAPVVSAIDSQTEAFNAQLNAVNQNLGTVAGLLRANGRGGYDYGTVEGGW